MKTEINNQKNEDINDTLDGFFEEPLPPPSEFFKEQEKIYLQKLHDDISAISRKYKISKERIDDLSCKFYEVISYMRDLCDSKTICVVEKKWGYKDSSELFGFIVNIRKCIDVTRNEIIIELLYEYGKIVLFKLDLDNPIISKSFRDRFDDIFVLRNSVYHNLVKLHLCNKKRKNGEVFSTVKKIEIFTHDEILTLISIHSYFSDCVDNLRYICRSNEWAKEKMEFTQRSRNVFS